MLLARTLVGLARRGRRGGGNPPSAGHHPANQTAAAILKDKDAADLSFSLSGAGFLAPVHIGVVDALLEKGVITDKTKVMDMHALMGLHPYLPTYPHKAI